MTPTPRHCERRKGARQSSKLWVTSSLMLLAMTVIFTSGALAKDKKLEDILEENAPLPEGYYSPDFCDFEIIFPEKPYMAQRCPEGPNKCYTLNGYRMVYDLQTTVDVTAICTPSTAENYKRYSENVMRAALKAMVSRADVKEYDINVQEEDNHREGSLLGSGTYGKQEKIYNAQLWVGQNSVMTIEAKLIGQSHDKADQQFSNILGSIKPKRLPKSN